MVLNDMFWTLKRGDNTVYETSIEWLYYFIGVRPRVTDRVGTGSDSFPDKTDLGKGQFNVWTHFDNSLN
jgi:hypothetical protein